MFPPTLTCMMSGLKPNSKLITEKFSKIKEQGPPRKKAMRMIQSKQTLNYYTDILSHKFNPFNSLQSIIGTTFGDVLLLDDEAKDDGTFIPMVLTRTKLPKSAPVVSIEWSLSSEHELFIASKQLIYRLEATRADLAPVGFIHDPKKITTQSFRPKPLYKNPIGDVMDIAFLKGPADRICMISNKGMTRVLDLTTKKIVTEFRNHTGCINVCEASNTGFVFTGGSDGMVYQYDSSFRTNLPISTYEENKSPVNNLAVSEAGSWLAISSADSSEIPSVYSIFTKARMPEELEKSGDAEKIHALTFDGNGNLYWGGPDGIIFKSEDMMTVSASMQATYGDGEVPHIFSITTSKVKQKSRLSAAGATNAVLYSSDGTCWDTMVHV